MLIVLAIVVALGGVVVLRQETIGSNTQRVRSAAAGTVHRLQADAETTDQAV